MTILETVIAATLISVSIVAALRLSTNTQKEAMYAKNLSLATKYNYQAFDWLKTTKNSLGWVDFSSKIIDDGNGSLYCINNLPDDTSTFLSFSPTSKEACSANSIPGSSNFYRTVEISLDANGNSANILVKTYWQGQTEHHILSETYLSNY